VVKNQKLTHMVSVTFLGKTYNAQADKDGVWQVMLDPVPAGGPHTMDIESGDEKITISDIYSGDVWLCAGQSNMEMQMERLRDDFPEEWTAKDFPLIRQFKVPQEWDFSGPRETLSGGSWLAPAAETLREFAAVPWFFAKYLCEKRRVPIGLLCTAWGGTPVESWMSADALKGFPKKIAEGKKYADPARREKIDNTTNTAIQEWEINLGHEDIGVAKEWQKPEAGISGWDDITLPGDFAAAGLAQFCGAIWLAKEFTISAEFAVQEAKLWLGTIVDADTVFINGVEIGNTTYRYPPRKYNVPAGLLRKGNNRIVIRVTCASGDGGVTRDKPFRIFTDNEAVEFSGIWKYKIGAAAPVRPAEFFFQRQPMGNYNAMIAPLLKYPLKGVIWYQGESNDRNPDEYTALFQAMIQDWRKKSGHEETPFLFVQLPIFGAPSENEKAAPWAAIREAQKNALSLSHTGMAAGLELGEWNDLHPLNKKDIGRRLFLAAEQTVFGDDNTAPGPLFRSAERRGEKIFLTFDNCGAGLCAHETPYISIVAGKIYVRRPATIEAPDTVSVDISGIESPETLLYAWANNPQDRQLYNSDGLPVIPFKVVL
jgi:sialate O-acetylesterase